MRLLAIATLGIALGGCALTSKSAPLDFRYFTLEGEPAASTTRAPAEGTAPKLRLGSVGAAAHLRERMVYRDSPVELGYHEEERWSERPSAYVRRALSRALFEERGIEQVLSGSGYALDADLLALDEYTGDAPKVRVTLAFSLHDDMNVALETTVSAEKPIAKKDDAPARVEAFRQALREVIAKISDQVMSKLQTLPSAVSLPAAPDPPREPDDDKRAECTKLRGRDRQRCEQRSRRD